MKWKSLLLSAGLTLSPSVTNAQIENQTESPSNSPQKEIMADSLNNRRTSSKKATLRIHPEHTNFSDSIAKEQKLNDTINIDTIASDSLALEWSKLSVREKINSCTDQMLIYLTTFEDIRAKAYWERAGGVVTVGPGFVYINNKHVNRNYRFKNMEALVNTWNKDLQKKGSWLDNYEAYMYEIIENMHPTNTKELLACQSEICAPFSLVWQNHTKSLGSAASSQQLLDARRKYSETKNPIYKNKADSIFNKSATKTMKAYLQYKRTGTEEDKEAFKAEYMSWCKITVKNKNGQPLKDKNNKVIKKTIPSSVARREAEFSFIVGDNVMTMGSCPQELENDSTVKYVDVLDLAVGAALTLKNPKTGELPEDWVEKAQHLKTDTTTARYQKEFPELRQTQKKSPLKEEKNEEEQNPIIQFFRNLRSRSN